jgi:tRNA-splicing ligase RtcB (3'-phosphate/5'-hydroxy nucleic acid ligase)
MSMDISRLQEINEYTWSLEENKEEKRGPVRFYGSKNLLEVMDEKVFEQITNVAKLPGLIGSAMTMPDAHWGYGFPIGGVAAFDPEQGGIISAGGVGFDISCGIRCLRTNLNWLDVMSHAQELAEILFKRIPAGVGIEGRIKLSPSELDDVLEGGADWAVQQGYGVKEDLLYVEEKGRMQGAIPEHVSLYAKKRQRGEMGTVGSGNHYLEIQVVDRIFDVKAANAFGIREGDVIISIHCGSRGLGHQIGTDYLVTLAKEASKIGLILPDRELASAPIQSVEGQRYIGAMRAGINCALANRQILTHLTREALAEVFPNPRIETLYDVSHNTCKQEKHRVQGKIMELFVHRKGATRAFGPGHPELPKQYQEVGQPVLIGGSMGTGSYILAGNAENEAYASASHGAGRAMSRHEALKYWRGHDLIDQLAERGILIRSRTMRGVAEEAPGAYKDVDEVALSTEKAGLARRVAFLRPKICVKG